MGGKIDRFGPRTRTRFKVLLSCGHHIKTISDPMRKTAKYPCRNGTGCGYNLAWISYEDTETNQVWTNAGEQEGKS